MLGTEFDTENLKKLKRNAKNTQKALLSLEDVLQDIKNKSREDRDFVIYRDSAIKRFEYTIEVSRKLMAYYIEYVDKKINGQKLVLKKAFEFDLIEDKIWFTMVDDRNLVTHEYSEAIAVTLLEDIFVYAKKLRVFYETIDKLIENL
ncbi:MAG: HI0074 family nucleotidyltransferase substrate-binding subunit [Campylobacterota bacterium]|nr:HI0074 family nucleotidyltransferase substrate-binding subunit [Campylobacterota bacterium]